jgi:hypothetical protein
MSGIAANSEPQGINMLKLPTRLWPKGQVWAEYNEIVPAGTSLQKVMSRDYWVNVEKQLRPLDVITCVAEDGTFDVDIRLISKTSTELKFRLIREAKIETYQPVSRDEDTDRYVVKSGGRAGGWTIREKATGLLIAEGLDKAAADAEKDRLEALKKAA